MLRSILNSFRPVLYVRISPERLRVRNVRTAKEVAEVPELAISNSGEKSVILGAGAEARKAAVGKSSRVVNPFAHPRTLASDFTVAEALLKAFVRRVLGNSTISLAPVIVMHPLGSPEGGFTQVERRVFRELALGVGASSVAIRIGRELTDSEALSDDVLSNQE